MKKSLFFAAAVSALMLTACSSENDVVQSAAQLQQSEAKAVGFDVYTQNATDVTRGGYKEGVMNTTRLQSVANGFGIFGYYTDQSDGTAREYPYTTEYTGTGTGTNDYIPNFMVNEHVTWNETNKGWMYSPLKYWPNETNKDSQTEPAYMERDVAADKHLDRLTFFAYAPYVDPAADGYDATEGIMAITGKDGKLGTRAVTDPLVQYKAPVSVVNGVDLLWRVAPAGGQHYTAVNGDVSGADQGYPYLNLIKPDVNTSLKFYFQHALARFGFTVAAAIDQVPQGGTVDENTKITVAQVNLIGYFGTQGILNLNNKHEGVANWINNGGTDDLSSTDAIGIAPLDLKTLSITTDIANDIEDSRTDAVQTVEGVIGAKKDLIQARYYQVDQPTTFKAGDKYYTSGGDLKYATLNVNETYYYVDAAGNYKKVTDSRAFPTQYYTLTNEGSALTGEPASGDVYQKSGDDYNLVTDFTGITDWSTYYQPTFATTNAVTAAKFTWPGGGDYFKPERSYFMVIPTNNIPNICTGITSDDDKKLLKTVWVEITYYVTTKDTKLNAGFSRIKNVITKKVELPSLENGKSYNLHLLLGLTSVKVEAEVADWSEEFIQTDLPQNTPGE